ncbi:MAG: hypothetical protein KZQ59_03585 [Candidatus Thiodiazotropha sp. (ex Lucinoma aequizonata)]|nr:hypothetical protein [Candidatus Thiodiazotropha sp. (ex Lucinoma aequizonata)]
MASKNKMATKSSICPLFDNSLFLKHSSNSHGLECNELLSNLVFMHLNQATT